MGYFTAEALLEAAVENGPGERAADVDLLGGKVKVRGLTAAEDAHVSAVSVEVKQQGGRGGGNTKFRPDSRQKLVVKYGLVEPKLNDDQVSRFLSKVGADDCAKIVDKINELSGTTDEDKDDAEEAFPES